MCLNIPLDGANLCCTCCVIAAGVILSLVPIQYEPGSADLSWHHVLVILGCMDIDRTGKAM